MSGDYTSFPPEIWYQILTKLPVKSILRFRCVCKTWHSLISSPNFISDYPIQKRTLISRYDGVTNLSKFSSHDESFVESHEHGVMSYNIVGSCNGLICLWKDEPGPYGCSGLVPSFLIWNPNIQKIIELPSRVSSSLRERGCLYGFGFDSYANDYKVLRVHPKVYNGGLDCEIFDLRKGVWRSLIPPKLPPYSYVEKSRSSLYLNGFLHWIGYDLHRNCILLSFDLSIEAFGEVEMPSTEDFKEVDLLSQLNISNVSLIKGLMSVAVLRTLDTLQQCSVWSMKEYGVTESWTKLFHIDLSCRLYRWDFFGFSENGELFVLNSKGNKNEGVLALYNPESGESKVLVSADKLKDVCFYNESLVLL